MYFSAKCSDTSSNTATAVTTNQHIQQPGTMSAADLAEISTEDLMKEVNRRLSCLQKPEKRLVLIGTHCQPQPAQPTVY